MVERQHTIWGAQQFGFDRQTCPAVRSKPCPRQGLSTAIRPPFSLVAGISIFLWLVLHTTAIGQPVSHVYATPHGMLAVAGNQVLEVYAVSDRTVRIRATTTGSFQCMPYALADTNTPRIHVHGFEQTDDSVFFKTALLQIRISKRPQFSIALFTHNGQLINTDPPGISAANQELPDGPLILKAIQESEHFVGLGEALGPLDRRQTGVILNNTDNYRYGDPRVPMYSSIPFFLGIHHHLAYGLFANNSHSAYISFGQSSLSETSLHFSGGPLDYFLMYGPQPTDVMQEYTALTGRMPMPPKWSIGYQQSRCSYFPQQEVLRIAETFRAKGIPLDGLVLDADYQQDYRPFNINLSRFPDLAGLSRQLRKMNIALTASVYPGVAIDSGYASYRSGLAGDVFIRQPNGKPWATEIAPVKLHLPDYTNPKARAWWHQNMRWMKTYGIRGYWNDMNEPAVGGSYLPPQLQFSWEGLGSTSAAAKNVYGHLMARSSFEAAQLNYPELRPFILTRSGFAGVQRYSALWSGDNLSTDEGMMTGILLNNQLGLSGLAFCGYDVGGYIGNASTPLYKRWIQAGVFSPYCRNHREFNGAASEPWAYGEEAEAISKAHIELRYRLLPYWYSCFYESATTGAPVVRAIPWHYPFDERSYQSEWQHQFTLGASVMVVPLRSTATQASVFLPAGSWYDMYTDRVLAGDTVCTLETSPFMLPAFVKAGAIIPMQKNVQHTGEHPGDTLMVHLYAGDHNNTFTWYDDDGETNDYQQGSFYRRNMTYEAANGRFILHPAEGSFQVPFRQVRLVLHGFQAMPGASATVNGQSVSITSTTGNEAFDVLKPLTALYGNAGLLQPWRRSDGVATYQLVVPLTSVRITILLPPKK